MTARRFGYALAAMINLVLVYVVNVWPGWQAVPFLTEETRQVVPLVTLSLAVSATANVLCAVVDRRWMKTLGDLLTAGIGIAALGTILRVFPFDFAGYSVNWALLVRLTLTLAMLGSVIGVIVLAVSLIRQLFATPASHRKA